MRAKFPAMASLLALSLAFSGPAAAQAPGQAMPPTPVLVLELKAQPQPIINELPGRISATRVSQVLPRVSGILVERVFEQGSIVKEGDVLYRIDPKPFQVRVQAADAQVARAKASLANAEVGLKRVMALRERNVSAQSELDAAQTLVALGEADVAAANAALAEAQLNLDYTEVRAPISGTIGRALVTEGALVSSTGSYLALIQQLDPVYADFTQSTTALLDLKRAMANGTLVAARTGEATVKLYFDDGSEYPHTGRLLFSEATVDETTGQVTLRGEFPNPEGYLLPGLYVRIRIEQAVREDALSIPQKSVLRDTSGNASVYVVGAENKAEVRPVRLGPTVADGWIVESGLKDGDKVVIEGAQKLFPGADIAPELAGAAAATDAAAAPAAADAAPEGTAPAAAAPEAAPAAAPEGAKE